MKTRHEKKKKRKKDALFLLTFSSSFPSKDPARAAAPLGVDDRPQSFHGAIHVVLGVDHDEVELRGPGGLGPGRRDARGESLRGLRAARREPGRERRLGLCDQEDGDAG